MVQFAFYPFLLKHYQLGIILYIALLYKKRINILKIIEINKIMLVCIVNTGQVIFYKVMMDIHIKIKMVIILSLVEKIGISKQLILNFMELILIEYEIKYK